MEERREAENEGLPEKRCQEFGCVGHIVCVFGIGILWPARFQCSDCHRNLVAMQQRGATSFGASYLGVKPGDIMQIGSEKMRVESVNVDAGPGWHGEKVMFSGSLEDQIEFEDEDQCGDLTKRDKLTRKCRRCVFPVVAGDLKVSMSAKVKK